MIDETKLNKIKEQANLTAEDLVAIQAVIELATRRGAFQANEISNVGQIFDKLKTFNEYIAKNVTEKLDEVQSEQ
jgi:hypothetical protein